MRNGGQAPGQQREGPSPQGIDRKGPEKLEGHRAQSHQSWGCSHSGRRERLSREKLAMRGWAVSDGLVVAHVPDLRGDGGDIQQWSVARRGPLMFKAIPL